MNPLNDMSGVQELGRQVHDSIMALISDDGHDILSSTETWRPPVLERAHKLRKGSTPKLSANKVLEAGTDDTDADVTLVSDE